MIRGLGCRRCLALGLVASASVHAAMAGWWLSAPTPAPNGPQELELELEISMFQPLMLEPAVSQAGPSPPDPGGATGGPADAPATETLALAPEPEATTSAVPESETQPEPEPVMAPTQDPHPSTAATPTPETPEPEAPLTQPQPRAEKRLAGAQSRPKRESQTSAPRAPRPLGPKPQPAQRSLEPPDASPRRDPDGTPAPGSKVLPTGAPGGPTASSPASASQAEAAYLAELQRAIARHQRFPDDARRRQRTGVVTLSFLVQGDGSIRQIRLVKSSGDTALDEAALQAMQRLNRFKPIPGVIGRQEWAMRVPIRFDLR